MNADERRLRINSICVNLRLSSERSERAVTREGTADLRSEAVYFKKQASGIKYGCEQI